MADALRNATLRSCAASAGNKLNAGNDKFIYCGNNFSNSSGSFALQGESGLPHASKFRRRLNIVCQNSPEDNEAKQAKDSWTSKIGVSGFKSKDELKSRRRGGRKGKKSEKPVDLDSTQYDWARNALSLARKQTKLGLYGKPIPNFTKLEKDKQRRLKRGTTKSKPQLLAGKSDNWLLDEERPAMPENLIGTSNAESLTGSKKSSGMELSEEMKARVRSQVKILSDASGFKNRLQEDLMQLKEAGTFPESDSDDEEDLSDDEEEEENEAEEPWQAVVQWEPQGSPTVTQMKAALSANPIIQAENSEETSQKVGEGEEEDSDMEEEVDRRRRPLGKRHLAVPRGGDPWELTRRFQEASSVEEALHLVTCEMEIEGIGGRHLSPLDCLAAVRRLAELVLEEGRQPARATWRSARLAGLEEVARLTSSATAAAVKGRGYSEPGMGDLVWGLTTLGGTDRFSAEVDAVLARLADSLAESDTEEGGEEQGRKERRRMGPGQLSRLVASLARARHGAPAGLVAATSARAAGMAERFGGRETSGYLWGCATLAEPPVAFLDRLDERVVEDESWVDSWTDAQLASSAWSLAVLAASHRPVFEALWNEIQIRGSEGRAGFGVRQLAQIYQAGVTLSLEAGHEPGQEYGPDSEAWSLDSVDLDPELDSLFEGDEPGLFWEADLFWQEAKQAWQGLNQRIVLRQVASGLESKLSYYLSTVGGGGWVPQCPAAEYSLDFGLPELKIGIEVDGPSHFSRNARKPLGATLLKRRHLAAAGWRVVSVPYWEWESLYGEAEQAEYVRKLMAPFFEPMEEELEEEDEEEEDA